MNKDNISLKDKIKNWTDKHKFLACIITSTIVVTVIGLGCILPLLLTFAFSPWWFLCYLPIGGFFLGVAIYMDFI